LERLRQIRERAGYSQQDLADESGVSQHTISEIELGRRKPQGRTLRKLAQVLGVEVADLYGDPDSPLDKAPHSPEQPSLNGLLEDLRRTTERYVSFHAVQNALDEYREVWEKRLAEGDFDKTSVEEAGRAISAFWPAMVIAAEAEVAENERFGSKPEEAAAKSVLLPALARFHALGDRVNSTYRETFPSARVYVFPHREAS
jgi:transcriptional regulator with XRE-family HTH domain